MEQRPSLPAVKNKLERTRHFMGGYWVFLTTGAETNGQFSLIEVNLRKGLEPPMHTHTFEDESFYVTEGEIQVTLGDEGYTLKAGDFLRAPKGVPHVYKLQTEKVKMLVQLCPAGLEDMFMEMSQPATIIDYPQAPAGPPPVEWLQKAAQLQQQYGIIGMTNNQIRSS